MSSDRRLVTAGCNRGTVVYWLAGPSPFPTRPDDSSPTNREPSCPGQACHASLRERTSRRRREPISEKSHTRIARCAMPRTYSRECLSCQRVLSPASTDSLIFST